MFVVERRRWVFVANARSRRMGPPMRNCASELKAGTTVRSIHLLVGVDAPQPLLLDPAVKTGTDDTAPTVFTFLDLGHDTGLQPRGNGAGRIGAIIDRREFVLGLHGDDGGAAA